MNVGAQACQAGRQRRAADRLGQVWEIQIPLLWEQGLRGLRGRGEQGRAGRRWATPAVKLLPRSSGARAPTCPRQHCPLQATPTWCGRKWENDTMSQEAREASSCSHSGPSLSESNQAASASLPGSSPPADFAAVRNCVCGWRQACIAWSGSSKASSGSRQPAQVRGTRTRHGGRPDAGPIICNGPWTGRRHVWDVWLAVPGAVVPAAWWAEVEGGCGPDQSVPVAAAFRCCCCVGCSSRPARFNTQPRQVGPSFPRPPPEQRHDPEVADPARPRVHPQAAAHVQNELQLGGRVSDACLAVWLAHPQLVVACLGWMGALRGVGGWGRGEHAVKPR